MNIIKQLIINEKLPSNLSEKILENDKRVELINNSRYVCGIFFIPEYCKETKSLNTIEINLLYIASIHKLYIIAYKTNYFFEKYKDLINEKYNKVLIEDKDDFGKLLSSLFEVILEDETKIIFWILCIFASSNKLRAPITFVSTS